jgi:hypothetical protein
MSEEITAEHLAAIETLHGKITRTLSEHRQSFGHNDEEFWSFCSCNENEPHIIEAGPDMPDPVEKRAFWATGVEIFAEHLAARAVDEVEEAGWVSPEEAKAREAAARREALLEAREDIRARRRTFSDLNADPQYLAAMSDAFGLVNNRIAEPDRDVECIASPHVNSQTG